MPVFWWIRLYLVFLVGRTVSSGVFWGVCELMILAASLLIGGAVFLSCLLFSMGCTALKLAGP